MKSRESYGAFAPERIRAFVRSRLWLVLPAVAGVGFGCLWLYRRYVEGLPVVVDPGILSPKAFIDEVVEQRLPNPFMPDSPQRIATDTSQKVGIRFGETIKSYVEKGKDLHELTALSLAIAGWLRYLLGVGDDGKAIEISADPMKDELQVQLAGIEVGRPESYNGQIRPILANANIFGSDLCALGMADRIEEMFVSELAGEGAVRRTLEAYLG